MWYYAKDNEQLGPVELSKLIFMIVHKELPPDTLVWTNNMSSWQPFCEIDGFKEYFQQLEQNTTKSASPAAAPPQPEPEPDKAPSVMLNKPQQQIEYRKTDAREETQGDFLKCQGCGRFTHPQEATIIDNKHYCPQCRNQRDFQKSHNISNIVPLYTLEPANFIRRTIALFIDFCIVMFLVVLFSLPYIPAKQEDNSLEKTKENSVISVEESSPSEVKKDSAVKPEEKNSNETEERSTEEKEEHSVNDAKENAIISLILLLTCLAYFCLLTPFATVGKFIMGLRVLMPSGERISFGRSFARYILFSLECSFCALLLFLPLLNSENTALHDMICSTRVFHKIRN